MEGGEVEGITPELVTRMSPEEEKGEEFDPRMEVSGE